MTKKKEIIKMEQSEEEKAKQVAAITSKRDMFSEENKMAYEAAMAKMNEKYVVINIGGRTTIYNTKRGDNRMRGVRDARDYFANLTYDRKIVSQDNEDYIEKRQVFDDWFVEEMTPRFESLTFDPENAHGSCGSEWNTWRGWKYEPTDGDCSLYLDHILQNICGGDEQLSDYLLDYMAQIIQQPKRKIFHCIAIKGQKGTGKTIYVHHFMELFGDAAVEISDSEILTNQFNAILADRILVYGDEAFWSGDRKNRGKLKNLISSDTIRITYKMKDTITMPNHLRFMFTTNEDWAAPVENEERRWVTLRCGEARMNDRDYFGRMEAQMENGGYNALMKLLLERDISQRDWSHVPMTEASKEDMAYTTVGDNVVAEYLDQCVGGMEFGDVFSTFTSGTVPSSTFTSAVKEYASKSKAYPSITPAYVASKLKDIFGRDFKSEQKKEDGKRNIRVFKFGSIDEVEKKINAYYNREEEVE